MRYLTFDNLRKLVVVYCNILNKIRFLMGALSLIEEMRAVQPCREINTKNYVFYVIFAGFKSF